MTKIVVQVFDTISLKNKYVCKLASPVHGDIWTYADDASLAWKFDSLHEAEQFSGAKFQNKHNMVYFF